MDWIKVSDHLPEEGEKVIILNADGDFAKAWFEDGDFECWDDTVRSYVKVLYWLRIPELPILKSDDHDYWEKPCPNCGENKWARDWLWGEDSDDEMPVWECDSCGWPFRHDKVSQEKSSGEIIQSVTVPLDDQGITDLIENEARKDLIAIAGKELVKLQLRLNKPIRLLSSHFNSYTKPDLSTINDTKIKAVMVMGIRCRWEEADAGK